MADHALGSKRLKTEKNEKARCETTNEININPPTDHDENKNEDKHVLEEKEHESIANNETSIN